ncbi:hypothetical protein AALD22_18250 [Lachnospiraceae bacterium 56-18]|jgi:hypothetical protein|uniref:hypothetical protein n=1 Tax=Sporofaciens sp. JLR.KK001 TaxID=3112621 RepID=UPI002FF0881B
MGFLSRLFHSRDKPTNSTNGRVQADHFLLFTGECLWDSLRDRIALPAETTCMVVNSLRRYPMLFTPDFDFQAAGLTINAEDGLEYLIFYAPSNNHISN